MTLKNHSSEYWWAQFRAAQTGRWQLPWEGQVQKQVTGSSEM